MFDLIVTQCYKEHFLGSVQQNQASGVESMVGMMPGSNSMQQQQFEDMGQKDNIIQIRPYNLRKLYKIRDLDPSHIDKFITIKGIVIRNSDVVPEMKGASFKCYKCHNSVMSMIEMGKI